MKGFVSALRLGAFAAVLSVGVAACTVSVGTPPDEAEVMRLAWETLSVRQQDDACYAFDVLGSEESYEIFAAEMDDPISFPVFAMWFYDNC